MHAADFIRSIASLAAPITQAIVRTSDMGTTVSPQLLVRWGHPTETLAPAPRRPLDAVLEAGATGADRGFASS